ncbi:MAG: hypothetical protein HXS43_01615 [Theionarchaea archaeon]|nr:hypothetical protein [Theionarchaea archaeon]
MEETPGMTRLNVGLKTAHLGPRECEKLQNLDQRVHTLDIYGVTINVCTNSTLYSEELSGTYERLITSTSQDPDAVIRILTVPEDLPVIHQLGYEEEKNVLEYSHDDSRLYIIPESTEPGNFFLSVMQVALFRILLDHNMFCAHASAASLGNHGVIFSGESNSGKTTLVMALLAEGHKYFSDDFVLIHTDTMMLLPLCSRLKPRGKTISMFPEMETEDAKIYMETETQVRKILSVGRTFPHLLSPPCPLTHIFFPTFNPEGETVLQPVSPSDGVIAFLKSWMLYRTEPTRVFPLISKIVRACKTYSLEYRDAREAVKDLVRVILGEDSVS